MTRKKKCTLEFSAIIQLYEEEGMRTVEIAKMANVSPRYINAVLQKLNVKRNPHGSWKRKYKVNEDYFKTWSNNMAYILGFFAADGYISSRNHTVCFSQKDPEILEQIRSELKSNHPLVMNNTDVCTLVIGSKIMKEALMNLHGMTFDKSKSLAMPDIPEEYFSHFVRGYFDGDGSVHYEGYTVTFVGGSLPFLEQLKTIFDQRNLTTKIKKVQEHFRLYIVSRLSLKIFADWIYYEKGIYLKRKYAEFQKEHLLIKELETKFSSAKPNLDKKAEFLLLLSSHSDVTIACQQIGVDSDMLRKWLRNDLEFKKKYNQML